MAENDNKDGPKGHRRGIARYVGFKRDGTSKDTEKNKNSEEKPLCDKQQTKQSQRGSQPLQARGLQGPFRPSIVGVRKHEDKRKRNESEDNTKFLHHIKSYEDLSPKRNQAKESLKEKSKCKVDFSNEAATKFTKPSPTELNPQQLKFHAKGSKPNGCNDLKKSKKELAGHVFELEGILAQLRKEKVEEERSHAQVQKQLKEAREAQSLLEKKLSEMKTEMTQKELSLSEHAQHLTSENKELLQTVADCRQKLQACKIDPVTLKPLELDHNEKQELENLQADSESNAELLKQKLEEMNQKHRKMIQNIQTQYETMKEVEVLKTST